MCGCIHKYFSCVAQFVKEILNGDFEPGVILTQQTVH